MGEGRAAGIRGACDSGSRACDIVATGAGLFTALARDLPGTWLALLAGCSGVAPHPSVDPPPGRCRAAASVRGLAPPASLRVPKHAKFMSRATRCGLHAALEAATPLRDVLAATDPYRVAIAVGSGEAGLDLEEFFPALSAAWATDPVLDYASLGGPASRLVDPYFSLRTLSNGLAALLAIELAAHGETSNFVQGATASAHALAGACRALAERRADVAIVVGCDSLVNVATWLALDRAGLLSALDPARACRPFDRARDGFVPGEAGAALVLERGENARARGASVLGEIAAVAIANDESCRPAGSRPGACRASGCRAAVRGALDGGAGPVAAIAFGDASVAGDRLEAAALDEGIGRRVPVAACTGATGMVGAATPLLQAVVALQVLREGVAPPVARLDCPDPGVEIDVVRGAPRRVEVSRRGAVLCVSRSVAGQHAAIVVTVPR